MKIYYDRTSYVSRWCVLAAISLTIAAALFAHNSIVERGELQPNVSADVLQVQDEIGSNSVAGAQVSPHLRPKPEEVRVTPALKVLRSVDEMTASSPVPDALEVLDDFEIWLAKASAGDTSAMVGIAQTLAGCTTFEPTTRTLADGTIQSSSQRCGSIPPEHRVPPDYWMERAAGHGDPRAMLHYGLNAKRLLSDPNTPSEQRNEIAKRAQAYLLDAARAGVREAFLVLIDAYLSGWYVPVDIEEAAAYLLALAELSPDSVIPEAAEGFLAGLRMHERSTAARRAKEIVASL